MAADLERLLRSARVNALLGWVLVAFSGLAAVTSLARGDPLWAGFAAVVVVLALLPPLSARNRRAMLPWEVLALAAFPLFGRSIASFPPAGEVATYLSVAAIALIVAVELHLFTDVRMSDGFAVLFVVVTTLATAGLWAVVRWLIDLGLGTGFLLDGRPEAVIEHALMLEFVASTVAGVVAGLVFALYVRRRATPEQRVPGEVLE
ncbi:MAG: hypothetical protein ABEJ89_07155 [Haloarculaceae archaeon]